MIERPKDSHKGDNGKIMIIGGSPRFYGAPILASMAAERTGCDLIFPFIPKEHHEAAKSHSLNFILHAFEKEHLSSKDSKTILNLAKKMDAVVIGPGLGTHKETIEAVKDILAHIQCPTVVDASALIYTNHLPKKCVLTPHRGEFKELTGEDPTPENVQKWARHFKCTIVCKGPNDIIADEDELVINNTGNAMMTVGGTGDVLSGFIGGLVARGIKPFEAGHQATRLLGTLADNFGEMEANIRASDLAHSISAAMEKL